jgi:hypothetical protein
MTTKIYFNVINGLQHMPIERAAPAGFALLRRKM